jgi:hypothetical protein
MKTPHQKVFVENGNETWLLDGEYHREDGPAIVRVNGVIDFQSWHKHGRLHREDGPAYVAKDGEQIWYVCGKMHRLDGPAWIAHNGNQRWYVNDQEITDQVNEWMQQQGVTWPWDEATQMQFVLTFT